MNPRLSGLKVLVVARDGLVRSGLQAVLELEGAEAVAAESGEAALGRLVFFAADVVIVDAGPPGPSAAETTRRLTREAPHARILTLSSGADPADVLEALVAGSSGYLLKDAAPEQILACVRTLAAGHVEIDPRVAGVVVAEVRNAPGAGDREPGRAPLSEPEREVLELIARGLANDQIGRALYISPSAVAKRVSRVLDKLGVENRIQAAAWAIRHGMVADAGRLAA